MAKKTNNQPETYIAKADAAVAFKLASATSPFTIEVRFLGGLTTAQKNAFKTAADRWTKVIVGDLPNVLIGGEVIDDILIEAQGVAIDGPGHILGQAGPTRLRPASAGASAFLPAKGKMQFDTADLAQMQTAGTLVDVITHEMGHVLGIGTIWTLKGLLAGANTTNPTFTGTNAKKEFGVLKSTGPAVVPVENTGGPGTANSHWRDTVFANELMTGFVGAAGNPMSRMTIASLKDLGYVVDVSKADPYTLPSHLAMAEKGLLAKSAAARAGEGIVLPIIPIVLPDSSIEK
jgi:hypothetical protein